MTFVVGENCIKCKHTDCVEVCPVDELPQEQRDFLGLNTEFAKIWPNITQKQEPLSDTEEWDGKPNKRELLER